MAIDCWSSIETIAVNWSVFEKTAFCYAFLVTDRQTNRETDKQKDRGLNR